MAAERSAEGSSGRQVVAGAETAERQAGNGSRRHLQTGRNPPRAVAGRQNPSRQAVVNPYDPERENPESGRPVMIQVETQQVVSRNRQNVFLHTQERKLIQAESRNRQNPGR